MANFDHWGGLWGSLHKSFYTYQFLTVLLLVFLPYNCPYVGTPTGHPSGRNWPQIDFKALRGQLNTFPAAHDHGGTVGLLPRSRPLRQKQPQGTLAKGPIFAPCQDSARDFRGHISGVGRCKSLPRGPRVILDRFWGRYGFSTAPKNDIGVVVTPTTVLRESDFISA